MVLGLLCRREGVAHVVFVGLGFRCLILAEIDESQVFYLNVLEVAPDAV